MKAYRKQVTKYYKWGDPNITLVGSPTVSDGVVSGFSTSKYLVIPNGYKSNNATYVFKFTTGSDITTQQCVAHAELLFNLEVTTAGYLDTYLFGTQKAYALFKLNQNTTYWIKVTVQGVTKTYSYSTDGVTFKTTHTLEDTGINTANTSYEFRLGLSSFDKIRPFLGSIDLKECYMEQSGHKVWTGLKQVEGTSSNYDFTKLQDVCYAQKKRQGYKDTYVNWTQPVMKSNSQNGIVVSASNSNDATFQYQYTALNGVKSGTPSSEDGWNCGNATTGWWQVTFPYKLKITKLIRYNNYFNNPQHNSIKGQFFTNSAKTTPIGEAINVTNETNWFAQEITPSSPVITDTIYFAKTGGDTYSGIGELDIIAQKVVPVKVNSGAEYYKYEYYTYKGV